MAIRTWIVAFGGPILLLLLTTIAGYAFSQTRSLFLPIPTTFALLTVILPLITGISTQTAYRLLRSYDANPQQFLYLLALFAFQLIYETIIATMSMNYMVPNCRLEEQWMRLYKDRNSYALNRIQDRFDCCGFKTVLDHAWPFPHGRPEDGFGADQCRRAFGREIPCAGPWSQAEQMTAGAFFAVAIIIFLVKAIVIIYQLSSSAHNQLRNPMSPFRRLTIGDLEENPDSNRAGVRRLVEEGNDAVTHEQYRDEVESGQDSNHANGSSGRPRVEPSGIALGNGGELWQESDRE